MKTKLILLAFAILLIGGIAAAQRTHPGHYLYKGQRVEVSVCEESALVYFRTSVMPADEVRQHYRCLREVRLDSRKADTLFATTVAIEGDYAAAIEELKAREEVWDVEPVLGSNGEVPVSNVFYVKLRSADDEPLLREMAEANGARVEGVAFEKQAWYILSVDKSSYADALTLSTIIGESGKVEDIDPGFVIEMRYHDNCDFLNDSHVSTQYLDSINVCKAWDIDTAKGRGVRIAIIDQGIDTTHQEFNPLRQIPGYDAVTEDTCASNRKLKHGTGLAGIIFAGHNNHQIAGIAPNATLVNITTDLEGWVLTEDGCYRLSKTLDRAREKADVVLCAWEGYNLSYAQQIQSALIEGILSLNFTQGRNGSGNIVVFAAGDNGNGRMSWPASADDRSIVVGGVYNSNYSPMSAPWADTRLDLVALYENVYTTDSNNSYQYMTGTSPAAAQVAGVVALMLSAAPDSSIDHHQIKRLLCAHTNKIPLYTYSYTPGKAFGTWNNYVGYGKLDAASAVLAASQYPMKDLRIRESANDAGEEYDSVAVSPAASQSVDIFAVYTSGATYPLYALGYGNTYFINVKVHNPHSNAVFIRKSNIKIRWTTIGGTLLWNSSWTNVAPYCYSHPRCGDISPTDTTQMTIAANGSLNIEVPLTVPLYTSGPCALSGAPQYIDIIAYVEDGDGIIGISDASCPVEWFVRANNQVSWRRCSLFQEIPSGPSGNGNPHNNGAITSLSPNPTTGTATLEYHFPEGIDVATVVVTSQMGMEVYRQETSGSRHEIDLRGAQPGVYTVYLIGRGNLLGMQTIVLK